MTYVRAFVPDWWAGSLSSYAHPTSKPRAKRQRHRRAAILSLQQGIQDAWELSSHSLTAQRLMCPLCSPQLAESPEDEVSLSNWIRREEQAGSKSSRIGLFGEARYP